MHVNFSLSCASYHGYKRNLRFIVFFSHAFSAFSFFNALHATVTELVFVGCLTSQQHASVCQGRICSDSFTCCHTDIEVADPTLHLTQSQYTDTGPTSPSADPITPGAWQGSHWSANFLVTGMTLDPGKISALAGFEPGIFRFRGGRLNH